MEEPVDEVWTLQEGSRLRAKSNRDLRITFFCSLYHPATRVRAITGANVEDAWPLNTTTVSLSQEQEFPQVSWSYLVLIREGATSEYFPDFQVVYYDRFSQRFQTEVYQPDDGTMEPSDVTNVVIAWYHLPSRLKGDSTA
jgi:hypothetical protein